MIYLDNNSTTQPLPEVVDAVARAMQVNWGNPSSAHALGRSARMAIDAARQSIASSFGGESQADFIFTASGTEAINLAFACLLGDSVRQILVPATEHSSVFAAARRWAGGRKIVYVPVSSNGTVDLEFLHRECAKELSLVSVSAANNETGVITDIRAVSRVARENRALLHVDAVQAAGKIALHFGAIDCDAASLAAHKFHGPPGCGILYRKTGSHLFCMENALAPGHQEFGIRAGTENLPAIVGAGIAAEFVRTAVEAAPRIAALRDALEHSLLSRLPGAEVHGQSAPRLANTSSIYCPGRNAADMVAALSRVGVAVSAGAACSNGAVPSHVILAMGFPESRANSTLRFSLSSHTTSAEAQAAVDLVEKAFQYSLRISTCN